MNKRLTYAVVIGIALAGAIILPSLYATAQEQPSEVTISVRRMNIFSEAERSTLSKDAISAHPFLADALAQADRKYQIFADWCSAQEYNCFDNSYSKVLDYTYSATIPAAEAKSALANLSFKELALAEKAPGMYHGMKVLYDGKYYAISIANIAR